MFSTICRLFPKLSTTAISTDVQQELYRSYAESAREELVKLVKKRRFRSRSDPCSCHTHRLKQICCHPAIFAKEKAEPGDSAKYDMLMELLQTLIEGKHKTVIFSQYTRMLRSCGKTSKARGFGLHISMDQVKIVLKSSNNSMKMKISCFLGLSKSRWHRT